MKCRLKNVIWNKINWANIDGERYLQVEEVDEEGFIRRDDDDDSDDHKEGNELNTINNDTQVEAL